MKPSARVATNIFFYLIGIFAITLYSLVIYKHAINIPKWDDFPEILQFLDRWLSAETASGKFSAFVSQTNEHILLVNHLIILAQYYLIGHINFAWLIYIGNIFYIGSALILWLFFKEHAERAFCFAVLMLCGVTFYSYDSTLWAMTAISNQAVIFFSFLAIYAVSERKNISIIMLLSVLAAFSQSNGLIILFVIGIYFFIGKEWLNLQKWLVFTFVVIGLYAHWFHPSTEPEQSVISVLQQLPLRNYLLTAPVFLAYFGGSVFTSLTIMTLAISFVIGTLIIALSSWQLQRNLFPKPVLMALGFLLLSILSIAAYRGLFIGPQVIFVSRYKMYGAYFLALGVFLSPLFILNVQNSIARKTGILSASMLYFFWSFPANFPQQKVIDSDLYQSMLWWIEDGDLRRARGFFIRNTDAYLFAGLKNKSYTPMVLLPQENIIQHIEDIHSCPIEYNDTAIITTDFKISHENPNAAAIKLISSFENSAPLTVTLCSAQQSYQFEMGATKNTANQSDYFISRNAIAPGTYRVWLKTDHTYYRLENPFLNKAATR
jgi:hypothetical protein